MPGSGNDTGVQAFGYDDSRLQGRGSKETGTDKWHVHTISDLHINPQGLYTRFRLHSRAMLPGPPDLLS